MNKSREFANVEYTLIILGFVILIFYIPVICYRFKHQEKTETQLLFEIPESYREFFYGKREP